MVGLEDIKKDVFKKIIYHIMNPTNNEDYLNTIISGPPGVGKTEFAKIYGELFVNLGILKNNNFIQIKRDDLVGKYLGETSMKTKQILENAIGGVLFLDEAYSLGNTEKRDSFSKEAIDMINVYLSEKKGQFMFIIAGYMDDIESCFFAYNKGLKRRFHSHYNITGYNPNEMKDIFIRKVIENKYNNMVDSNILLTFFTENMKRFNYFAGDIEKLFNEIKQCQALRIFNTNKISKDILYEDITAAMQEKLFEKSDEAPFGMYS
jgi:SpoVK/Ycf46/Vps4 family AAA+-type ATPase